MDATLWLEAEAASSRRVCSRPSNLSNAKLQAQIAGGGAASTSGGGYSGPIDIVRRVVGSEGVRGLWKGNVSCLAREVPGNMAWYGAYEGGVRLAQVNLGYDDKEKLPLGYHAGAGAIAGVAYWGVPFPYGYCKVENPNRSKVCQHIISGGDQDNH